ncbi:MAG: RNA polymerase sigma factor [Pseudomonadota bacterium]
MPSDAELIDELQTGKRQALTPLYERHADALYRFGLAQGVAAHLVAEALQETFLGLLEDASGFDARRSDSARGWLYGRFRNQLRRARREPPTPDAEQPAAPSAEDSAHWQRSTRDVAALIAQLPEGQREVLTLITLQDLSYEETAHTLDIAVGTVRSRLNRARAQLGEWLQTRPAATNNPQARATDTAGPGVVIDV